MIRRETDAECIDRVRKQVRLTEKWGRWTLVSSLITGIASVALAIGFGYGVQLVANLCGNVQNPVAPQPRELAWMGFSLGLILGFIAGFSLFKGMHYLVEGIELFRGDRINELLLRYHDAIMTMMQSERAESANAANGEQPEGPISLDQRSG
ncbi:MAG: hypothetical protein ACLQNE_05920 [Thermoguttaceae bacterium]